MADISPEARSLWGKLCRKGTEKWLPLYMHMSDSAKVAEKLWETWVPDGVKAIIGGSVPRPLELFVFLSAAHDVGKATPVFQLTRKIYANAFSQAKERVHRARFPYRKISSPNAVPHSLASYAIAVREGMAKELAIVLGGHHGVPPSSSDATKLQGSSYNDHMGANDELWLAAQRELLRYAAALSGVELEDWKSACLCVPAQMVLSGLVIMTDWLASDEKLFPLVDGEPVRIPSPDERADAAWESLRLPPCWEALDAETLSCHNLYAERFDNIVNPNPFQSAILEAVHTLEKPGILVLEAPMGEGKTEAALAAAEILASKTGRGGVFFALPTQATSDGIFPRMLDWIGNLAGTDDAHSIVLAHGKAGMNETYQGLRRESSPNVGNSGESDDTENVIVHEWFEGRKKGLLADFVVGTIDQILMSGLKQRHLAMRHLALANKVVIIDECHAYDAYMSSYLFKALNWMGAYRTPVIILSATLPPQTRQKLIEAYLDKSFKCLGLPPILEESDDYPLITYTDDGHLLSAKPGHSDRRITVKLAALADEALADTLEEKLRDGGCAGVIVNTVKRAQEIARSLSGRFDADMVKVLHSRMIACDRVAREKELREALGRDAKDRPAKLIVVGTQVMEQSLDVDFDLLVTDLCPMDLLLQRIGRLHRHERERPQKLQQALCYILDSGEEEFEKGSEWVYGAYMLMRTRTLLEGRGSVTLPDDIPSLVRMAYSADDLGMKGQEYTAAKEKSDNEKERKERCAGDFQIDRPADCQDTLIDLLNTKIDDDRSGKKAEASVRDAGDSIEVFVIQRRADGALCTLPFIPERGGEVITHEKPDGELARIIAKCSVRMPQGLSSPRQIDDSIRALEEDNRSLPRAWQESPWLKGELFLVLDEVFCSEIKGWRITYDEKYGLLTEKAGGEHGSEI